MSRTIELGRAVLAGQSANLELWLTTLITLSPQQHANNHQRQHHGLDLQQLKTNDLLGYLSSGSIWVGRATAMHISLDVTKGGEPVDGHQLRRLGDCIVNAPAWEQLNLCLTLPLNYAPTHGRLHLNVDQCREDTRFPSKADHITTGLTTAGVRPPEGVPTVLLQSVAFIMVISGTRSRNPRAAAPRKPPKQEAENSVVEVPDTLAPAEIITEELKTPEILDGNLDSLSGESKTPAQGNFGQFHTRRKRPHRSASPDRRVKPWLSAVSTSRRKGVSMSGVPLVATKLLPSFNLEQLAIMTDAAIRLSICNNLRGSICSLKLKANTFTNGLADIAPALWRPGHLSACSYTTHLGPTLARSLARISLVAKTASLQAKVTALADVPLSRKLGQDLAGQELVDNVASAIVDRVWIHNQKSHLSKALPGPIQILCAPAFHSTANNAALGEILEEYRDTDAFGNDSQDICQRELPIFTPSSQRDSLKTDDHLLEEESPYDQYALDETNRPSSTNDMTFGTTAVHTESKSRPLVTPATDNGVNACRLPVESVVDDVEIPPNGKQLTIEHGTLNRPLFHRDGEPADCRLQCGELAPSAEDEDLILGF